MGPLDQRSIMVPLVTVKSHIGVVVLLAQMYGMAVFSEWLLCFCMSSFHPSEMAVFFGGGVLFFVFCFFLALQISLVFYAQGVSVFSYGFPRNKKNNLNKNPNANNFLTVVFLNAHPSRVTGLTDKADVKQLV